MIEYKLIILTKENLSAKKLSKNIYELKKEIKSLTNLNKYDMSIIVVGLNKKNYLNSSELLTIRGEEFLD